MNFLFNFSERLNELMGDMTAKELGAAINHNFYDIYHWRSGKIKSLPLLKNIIKIADFFFCSIDFLLGLEPENYMKSVKIRPPFSKRLIFVIKSKGTKVYRLSKITGIGEGSFYDWINGKYEPTLDTLIRLASALDCSIDYLIGRE